MDKRDILNAFANTCSFPLEAVKNDMPYCPLPVRLPSRRAFGGEVHDRVEHGRELKWQTVYQVLVRRVAPKGGGDGVVKTLTQPLVGEAVVRRPCSSCANAGGRAVCSSHELPVHYRR